MDISLLIRLRCLSVPLGKYCNALEHTCHWRPCGHYSEKRARSWPYSKSCPTRRGLHGDDFGYVDHRVTNRPVKYGIVPLLETKRRVPYWTETGRSLSRIWRLGDKYEWRDDLIEKWQRFCLSMSSALLSSELSAASHCCERRCAVCKQPIGLLTQCC